MEFFSFREPASAWTHCVGMLLAIPAAALLWRRAPGDPGKRLSFLVYGLSLVTCYAASTLYHGLHGTDTRIAYLNRLDRAGIFLLIAGTYTPLAWNLMRGRWRRRTLFVAWMVAIESSLQLALGGPFPQLISTGLYLAMGWGSLACYSQFVRAVSRRAMRPLIVGGVFYSVGAVLNLLHWPALWPGYFGTHDLFHLFVMAGSFAHYRLMLFVIAPFRPGLRGPIVRPSIRSGSGVNSPAFRNGADR
jgi:hemolysin III